MYATFSCRIAAEYIFCVFCAGAMITFMRIMAKYGCEKVRNGIDRPLCVLKRSFYFSFSFPRLLFFEGAFSISSIYLHSRARCEGQAQKYVYKFITVTHFS